MFTKLWKYVVGRFNVTSECTIHHSWFAIQGDKTLRVQYDLNKDSVVFDLGGYEGQWASDIFARFCCNVYIFEPVLAFADGIRSRFAKNPHIRVFPFGLSAINTTAKLCVSADSTSQFKKNGDLEEVVLVKASDFLAEQNIKAIDLIKINIEGGEYELLEHLLDTGLIASIRDIQVQFHDFIPGAEARMKRIQERLSATHYLTYNYPFVWENWRRIEGLHTDVTSRPEIV